MRHFFSTSLLGSALLFALMGASSTTPPQEVAPAAPPAPEQQAQPASVKVGLLPHRAYYRITLASARNNSHVKAASGVMVFAWQDACNAWMAQQQLDVNFTHDEGSAAHLQSNYNTWEAKDGTRYRFNYKNMMNGEVTEAYRGTASLPTDTTQTGKAVYTFPEHKESVLPAGTLFPATHTLALLNAAVNNQSMLSATVFDGTDEKGLSDISAVLGAPQAIKVEAAKTGLGDTPDKAWPVRMAFFGADKNEQAEPDYEMDTTMLANGVSEFMLIDYGEFKLRGTLDKIEMTDKMDCH